MNDSHQHEITRWNNAFMQLPKWELGAREIRDGFKFIATESLDEYRRRIPRWELCDNQWNGLGVIFNANL